MRQVCLRVADLSRLYGKRETFLTNAQRRGKKKSCDVIEPKNVSWKNTVVVVLSNFAIFNKSRGEQHSP